MNDFIDISLIKNQNEIAVSLAEVLKIEELKLIKLETIEKTSRDLDQIQHVYYNKDLGNNKSIKIIDTLILDAFPAIRYVSIKLNIDDKIVIEYKCKYSRSILKYLAAVFGRACNFSRWKTQNDIKYVRSHILNNFSNKLSELSVSLLEELKFIIQYLIDDGSITNDNEFSYDFSIDKVNFHIESNKLGMIKFKFKYNVDNLWNTIYTSKNTVGLSNINLIINQALNITNRTL